MQPRRHRMRKRARAESALAWMRSGAQVTVGSYAKRYGVDRYTAYAELKAIGCPLPASADRWAQRPPARPRSRRRDADVERFAEPDWVMVGDRRMFVVGYTPNGVPYGCYKIRTWAHCRHCAPPPTPVCYTVSTTRPSGFAEVRGYPKVVTSSEQSYDVDLQQRLWSVSEELTGVVYAIG